MNGNKNKEPASDFFKGSGVTDKVILFFATWFYAGLIPFAPGTWGSLAALPFAAGAYSLGPVFSCMSLLIIFFISIPVSGRASKIMKKEDPSHVVIDEVAGVFVTLFLIPVSWTGIAAGFILFRIFDVIKPFPVGLIDKKIKGGAGIVLDDIMAGVYANVCLRIVLIVAS
ncbi:MAG: phosphatidylglycerophosphatase A [Desulfobacteraceae bacterium]|jgi:phosphatidylglycerophosphatase A